MSDLPQSSEPRSEDARRPRIGPLNLLIIFSKVTITGFGGVLPFAYRALVERRKLLGKAEFAECFALGQILPGPAIANFAYIVGWRDSGTLGAVAAVTGIVTLPMLLMMLVGYFYAQYADIEAVRNIITGMATVTGGLIVATALKMSTGMHRRWRSALLLLAGFVGFGLLRLPFLAMIVVLAPLAVWLAWRDAGPKVDPQTESEKGTG